MESLKVKLVKSQNTDEEFFIYLDKMIGEGGFGTVYEACRCGDKSQRLVAKIMKIQNQTRRKAIESQINILSQLPPHQNIVKILPCKIYSENNYYLFMQYCQGGTLFDQMPSKRQNRFSQEELYSIFYQCMSGYKVLFDKKILHQDIKPQNVLIRNGVYKLADFGLSIFYEGYNYTTSRQGTLSYIAPQKLTVRDYVGNPKSDIYSFGVMFFELITGCHPYVKIGSKPLTVKQFLCQLKDAKLRIPGDLTKKLSLKFNEFFQTIVLRMLKKSQKNRISFQQVWNFVQNKQIFENARSQQRLKTQQFIMKQYDYLVNQVTNVISVPLDHIETHDTQIQNQKNQKLKQQMKKMTSEGIIVAQYFVKRRIIVYLLDRLIRKLTVQQKKSDKKSPLYDRAILHLLVLTKSLLNELVNQIKSPKHFSGSVLQSFRKTHKLSMQIINILRKDHQYVEDSLCDLLSEPSTLNKKQVRSILVSSKQSKQQQLGCSLSKCLLELLSCLVQCIDTSDKSHLVTICNIICILQVLKDIPKAICGSEQLQAFEKKILMSSSVDLIKLIQKKCIEMNLPCGFDLSGVDGDDQQIVFE